jgi:hypothetical protein
MKYLEKEGKEKKKTASENPFIALTPSKEQISENKSTTKVVIRSLDSKTDNRIGARVTQDWKIHKSDGL